MSAKTGDTVTIEGATLIYKNFRGEEGQFNAKGDRNFSVILEPELADRLAADEWNVKLSNPREDGDEQFAFLPVSVSFKNRPPNIYIVTETAPGKIRRTRMSEDMVETLDWAEMINVDLIIRAYEWDVGGKGGIKAYLKSLFVTLEEDELEQKYSQMEDDSRFED